VRQSACDPTDGSTRPRSHRCMPCTRLGKQVDAPSARCSRAPAILARSPVVATVVALGGKGTAGSSAPDPVVASRIAADVGRRLLESVGGRVIAY
jgi:hypothetical protein